MLKKVLFVINPIFGINRDPDKIVQWIETLWRDSGVEYQIVKTSQRGNGTELAREAAARGVDMVVAAGGDGTINEVARGLIGTSTALGVIPAGSGNGFARNMGIPLDHRTAIAALREPVFRQIDAGKINDYYFFNVAGLGLDAIISDRFHYSKMRGFFPYFVIGVKEFFRYQPQPIDIFLDGQEIRRTPLLLSFANLPEFGINATIAPNARPDDGLIDLCILSPLTYGRAIVNLPKLFDGRIDQLPEMEIYQIAKAVIRRTHEGPIHTDGDPHPDNTLLTMEVLPGKLKLALGKTA